MRSSISVEAGPWTDDGVVRTVSEETLGMFGGARSLVGAVVVVGNAAGVWDVGGEIEESGRNLFSSLSRIRPSSQAAPWESEATWNLAGELPGPVAIATAAPFGGAEYATRVELVKLEFRVRFVTACPSPSSLSPASTNNRR